MPEGTPTINEQVAARIKGIGPDVESKVVDLLVDKEVGRRVDLITKGIIKADELQREFYKINKPDIEAFDNDGNSTRQEFTKERIEERKKHVEKQTKLNKAIEKALNGDVSDLANLVK